MIPFEILEVRLLLAADPTVYEQYMLYLVNRARANPALEAASFGIDLNEGVPPDQLISAAPKQPLAFNGFLNESADAHSLWMLETDIFDHTGINGSDPGDRDAAAGYNFVPPYAWGENIAYSGFYTHLPEPIMTIERLHGNLFVDEGHSRSRTSPGDAQSISFARSASASRPAISLAPRYGWCRRNTQRRPATPLSPVLSGPTPSTATASSPPSRGLAA